MSQKSSERELQAYVDDIIRSVAGAKQRLADRECSRYSNRQDEKRDRAIDYVVVKVLGEYLQSTFDLKSLSDELLRKVKTNGGRRFASSYHDANVYCKHMDDFLVQRPRMRAHGNPYYLQALERYRNEIKGFGIEVRLPENGEQVVELIPALSRSAGWTGVITGKAKKGDNVEVIVKRVKSLVEAAVKGDEFEWLKEVIIPELRTQVSDPYEDDGSLKPSKEIKEKDRFVWNVPAAVVVLENVFESIFFDFLRISDWYFNGRSPIESRVMINSSSQRWDHHITMDASSFDLNLYAEQIRDCREIEKSAFILSDVEMKVYDMITWYHTHQPLLMKGNKVKIVTRGMGSGHKDTNHQDSICFRIQIDTYCNSLGKVRGVDYTTINNGDDMTIYWNGDWFSYADWSSYAQYNFGTEMHPEKYHLGERGEAVLYGKRMWKSPAGEWRHPKNLVAKLMFPENHREWKYYEGIADPYEVVASFIVTYREGMKDIIDVSRFEREHTTEISRIGNADHRTLPGAIQAYLGQSEYERRYRAKVLEQLRAS